MIYIAKKQISYGKEIIQAGDELSSEFISKYKDKLEKFLKNGIIAIEEQSVQTPVQNTLLEEKIAIKNTELIDVKKELDNSQSLNVDLQSRIDDLRALVMKNKDLLKVAQNFKWWNES